MQSDRRHRAWIDVGGTFTDCFLVWPDGSRRQTKVLSKAHLASDGDRSCTLEAPVVAIRQLLQLPWPAPLPAIEIRLGTTRGTNALLTRTGARTAFVTTQGFADLLEIGYQDRPELFRLDIEKRKPLYGQVFEARERIAADGTVLQPLDLQHAKEMLLEVSQRGFESIAICLLHSYRNPIHEQSLGELCDQLGMPRVSLSHLIAPLIKAVVRSETTVIDAYLGPVVRAYLDRLIEQLGGVEQVDLKIMTSAGGLVDHRQFQGKDSILSGPAGGVVAVGAIAQAGGFTQAIGFDMGGTSTDVYRHVGRPQLEYEATKANVRLMIPLLAIHTVAAGGGSVCWYDGVQLGVGPASAGADPGPSCYGKNGPLAITDLNVLLGRIDSQQFPFPLDLQAARRRLEELRGSMAASQSLSLSWEALADGFRRVANQTMAEAIRDISIAQGADPRKHLLLGFGGAAGQHLCEVAELLAMTQALDPPDAGLLSALGMGLADLHHSAVQPIYQMATEWSDEDLDVVGKRLDGRCRQALLAQGASEEGIESDRRIELRYLGTDQAMTIPWSSRDRWYDAFSCEHEKRYGYRRENRELELVALRCEAFGRAGWKLDPIVAQQPLEVDSRQWKTCQLFSRGEWRSAWVVSRNELEVGSRLKGPGRIHSSGSTTIVEVGWQVEVLSDRSLLLTRDLNQGHSPSAVSSSSKAMARDPIMAEVVAQRVAAIARQMGIVLEQTAISVNIKERRDFSCAVFTAEGELIANAPHVPVHLGAMGETVREILRSFPSMSPGDSFVTNDPYRGGSHLPDITVVSPVFDRSGSRLLFLVANRAHHAEIGGIAPGSMAPTSRRLGDEGVIIEPMAIVDRGRDRSDEVRRRLQNASYPSRAVQENMADLAAQQAANRRGEAQLIQLVEDLGESPTMELVRQVLAMAEEKVERWLNSLGDVEYDFGDYMDDGTPIRVRLKAHHGRLIVDYAGTGPVSTGNLNANPAIVKAATLYVVRCMIQDHLPLNAGVLRRLDIRVPEGLLNPPAIEPVENRAAVAAGNVETSQRIVDCLLGALGVAGASQGTMNNFLFGDRSFGYYETIGGGAGATALRSGAHAVHTHMTNTRLTDVEVLEARYPVQVTRFEIRRGSGGAGRHRGGDGMTRELKFLRPVEVSLVTSRRAPYAPYGMAGGLPGSSGENWHIDRHGNERQLPGSIQLHLEAGERIRVSTPGGGGYNQE